MAGIYTPQLSITSKMVELKSVLRNVFKVSVVSLSLSFFACASNIGQTSGGAPSTPNRPILNLRLLQAAGPNFGEIGAINDPSIITLNNLGEIYIADRSSRSIYKFSPDLTAVSREGGFGGSSNGFARIAGLACDAALNIYVADPGSRQIQVLDRNLHFVKSINSYFDENDNSIDLSMPSAVDIDKEGNLWIADDDKVVRLDPFYKLLYEASDRKSTGYFILGHVASLSISQKGIVAIGDEGNGRIILLSIYGNYIGQFQCNEPSALTWDDEDNIWVARQSAGILEAFDMSGNLRYSFSGNRTGSKLIGVAAAGKGRILALDKGFRQIDIFDIIRGAVPTGDR
jgi:hypothetical protein